MLHQLPHFFSYQAPGKIWQIKADHKTNCLALEVRNQVQEVSFSYVCPVKNQVLFEGLTIEGGMLTNLQATYNQILLFQQFDSLENPSNASSIALDAHSQEVLWALESYRHQFFWGQESVGKTAEEEQEAWVAIDLQQGSIRDITENELLQLLNKMHNSRKEESLHLPACYHEGEANFTTVADFIQLYLQLEAVKSCEYLHVFDKMVISFYTARGEKIVNQLVVFGAEGDLLLHQIIAQELLQPGSETFMVWNQQLYFVEDSSCLKGYNL